MAEERNLKTFLKARKAKALKAQERTKTVNKKPIEQELAKGNLTDTNNMKITTKKRSFKKRAVKRELELER